MVLADADPRLIAAARRLVQRVLAGGIPHGAEFDACRAVVRSAGDDTRPALTMLLEGALAEPTLDIDDAQVVVPVLKHLARGTLDPEDVL